MAEPTEPMSAERLAALAKDALAQPCDCCAAGGYKSNCNCDVQRYVDASLAHIGVLTRALEFYAVGHDGGKIARTALGKGDKA